MKGHLVSNQSRATGYNNGRRVAKTTNGTFYMVYEDGGAIYITSSTDGQSWSVEQRLSSANTTCKTPSIGVSINMVFISWFNTGDQEVKIRLYNAATDTWGDIFSVNYVQFTGVIDPAPAITVSEIVSGQYDIYIAYHQEKMGNDWQGTGQPEIVVFKNTSNDGSSWSQILGPFNGKNPSVSHSSSGGNGDIGLV